MRGGSAPTLLTLTDLSQQEIVFLHVLVAGNQDGIQTSFRPNLYLSSRLLCAALALSTDPAAAGWSASSACWSTQLGRAATPVRNSNNRSIKLLNL